MGTAFAGIVRTPLTSVIMIFEMTRDYSIIVPLMISNLISFFISYKLQREPIYEALAHQEGVYLPTEDRVHDARLTVAAVLRNLDPSVDEDRARQQMDAAGVHTWPIVTEGCLTSMLDSRARSTPLDFDNDSSSFTVHVDQPLSAALEKMGSAHLDTLPVVSRADRRKVLGVITMGDVLAAYGVAEKLD